MIEFSLDGRSGVSPYLQVVHQVRQGLRLGLLREGDQLPTVKDVVARLAINPNTVLKAYRELERDGLVAARPGIGTFVTRSLTFGWGRAKHRLAAPGPSAILTPYAYRSPLAGGNDFVEKCLQLSFEMADANFTATPAAVIPPNARYAATWRLRTPAGSLTSPSRPT